MSNVKLKGTATCAKDYFRDYGVFDIIQCA